MTPEGFDREPDTAAVGCVVVLGFLLILAFLLSTLWTVGAAP